MWLRGTHDTAALPGLDWLNEPDLANLVWAEKREIETMHCCESPRTGLRTTDSDHLYDVSITHPMFMLVSNLECSWG